MTRRSLAEYIFPVFGKREEEEKEGPRKYCVLTARQEQEAHSKTHLNGSQTRFSFYEKRQERIKAFLISKQPANSSSLSLQQFSFISPRQKKPCKKRRGGELPPFSAGDRLLCPPPPPPPLEPITLVSKAPTVRLRVAIPAGSGIGMGSNELSVWHPPRSPPSHFIRLPALFMARGVSHGPVYGWYSWLEWLTR